MEIIKLLVNIIKKILKYFFILLIIGAIIGVVFISGKKMRIKKSESLI